MHREFNTLKLWCMKYQKDRMRTDWQPRLAERIADGDTLAHWPDAVIHAIVHHNTDRDLVLKDIDRYAQPSYICQQLPELLGKLVKLLETVEVSLKTIENSLTHVGNGYYDYFNGTRDISG